MENNDQVSDQAERNDNPVGEMAGARVISYNFNEGERPAGIRIRAKIRVVKGRQAEAVNAAQAEAIRELLLWSRQHRTQQERQP